MYTGFDGDKVPQRQTPGARQPPVNCPRVGKHKTEGRTVHRRKCTIDCSIILQT